MFRLTVLLLLVSPVAWAASNDRVFYAGNSGRERFYGVYPLSDGTVLVAGTADDLNWVPAGVTKTLLSTTAANGSVVDNSTIVTNKIGFILHLSGDLSSILRVVHFAAGAVNEIRHLKATTAPFASPTGDLFISGSRGLTTHTTNAGYYIAKLNNNFVNGPPSGLSWVLNVQGRNSSEYDTLQPWDVQNDGKVVLIWGKPFDTQWSEINRIVANPTNSDVSANSDVVPGWRLHTMSDSSKFYGPTNEYAGPATARRSHMIMKHLGTTDSGLQRSYNSADYNRWERDEAGFWRKGRYPLDMFWKTYWLYPTTGTNNIASGDSRGYDGAWYRLSSSSYTPRVGAIVIDKRNNHCYLGVSVQSTLPDGNPDFEPYVMALDGYGYMKWWTRLYKEYDDNGPTAPSSVNTNLVRLSTPDQYVDGLAVDYTAPLDGLGDNGLLYVLARSHGNNVVNFWNGSNSFHNGFTGTSGNIHLSWIGKLRDNRSNAALQASSWCAEYAEGTGNLGAPYSDPNLDLWPSHNSGWPDLNTTRMRQTMWVNQAGQVCVIARDGRRTITTRNAYQRNVRPQIPGTVTSVASSNDFTVAGLTNANLIVTAGCTVKFTSGPNNNQTRTVASFDNATGRLTTVTPFPSLPVAGNTLTINEGVGQWNAFVRVFSTNLNTLVYSSLLTSQINPVDGSGAGNNTELHGLFPIHNGVLVAGFHTAGTNNLAIGNSVPTRNVPSWGSASPTNESALLARLLFSDEPGGTPAATITAPVHLAQEWGSVPGNFQIALNPAPAGSVTVAVTRTGSAISGADYAAVPTNYVFAAAQTVTNISVLPVSDDVAEGDETVMLTIVAGSGYTVGSPASATVTIQDKPMDAWRVAWFADNANNPAIACDTCDPEGDGLGNLLEYAFDLNPNLANTLPGPTTENGYLTLTYTRVKAATDITYRPEVTGTMPGGWTNNVVTVSVTDQGATELIKVRDTVPMSGAATRFIRVRISRP
jgi:hypothetical protein